MFKAIILPKAIHDLSRLDKPIARRIIERITWLSENIESITPVPLQGNLAGFYKLKAGDWRVIYDIDEIGRIISVHKIGHRREIYK